MRGLPGVPPRVAEAYCEVTLAAGSPPMKRLSLMLALAVSLAAATAQAQNPVEQAPATPSAAEPQATPADEAQAPTAEGEKKRLSDANCVRETGSRIARRDGKSRCTGQPGRSYSKEDLDRTGHTNIGDALRALDPAVY